MNKTELEALAVVLDASIEDEGWNGGCRFVVVQEVPPGEVTVTIIQFDGHPIDFLDGVVALPEWDAVGVAAEGWAVRQDPDAPLTRPSEAKGRLRVRSVVLVGRSDVVAGMHVAGEGYEQFDEPGEGPVLDALRAVVGRARGSQPGTYA